MLQTCLSPARLVSLYTILFVVRFLLKASALQPRYWIAANIGHVHVHWPWWKGLKLSIVVSGVEVQGVTRVHPQASSCGVCCSVSKKCT